MAFSLYVIVLDRSDERDADDPPRLGAGPVSDLGRAFLGQLDADDLAELRKLLLPSPPAPGPVTEIAPLLTPAEAARRAGCHAETMRRAVRDGRLAARRAGRALRIDPLDLEAWLTSPQAGPQSPVRTAPSQRAARAQTNRRPLADVFAQREDLRRSA